VFAVFAVFAVFVAFALLAAYAYFMASLNSAYFFYADSCANFCF